MKLCAVILLAILITVEAVSAFLSVPTISKVRRIQIKELFENQDHYKNTKLHVTASLSPFVSKLADPTLFGGALSGGLHAISGPDHLAAILPTSVGRSTLYGMRVGAIWGLGHGFSATVIGMVAFFLKDRFGSRFQFASHLSNLAEKAVGLSLIAIGLLGMKESMEIGSEHDHHEGMEGNGELGKKRSSSAIFANGVLHGFSLDGAPSLAPAIAMASWKSVTMFLAAYSLGTMATMSLAAGIVGGLSRKIGEIANKPDLPKKLSFYSSLFAVIIGVYWLIQSFSVVGK